jgi:hypothetical protein
MNDTLRSKIMAKLEVLSDERGRQVLDYMTFLESKYNRNRRDPTPFQRITETVDETLGTSRFVDAASKGTSSLVQAAGKVFEGLAEAGRVVVEEIQGGAHASHTSSPASPDEADGSGSDTDDELDAGERSTDPSQEDGGA